MSDMLETALRGLNEKLAGGGLKKSIALQIKDVGTILIDQNGAALSNETADCTLTAAPKTFQGLLDGSINPMTAVMLGKLKISGDMSAALKLGTLLG